MEGDTVESIPSATTSSIDDIPKSDEIRKDSAESTDVNDEIEEKPKRKKPRKKATTVERVVGEMMNKFMEYQAEAEARYLEYEEKQEDRQHEERLMRMI